MKADLKNIDSSQSLAFGKGHNPFPGLRPFKIEESHLFFGREGQSDEVLLKLSQHRFVGIIGPSGSGKSSFIYCGVLPILYGGFLTGASTEWEVVVTRPGASPIQNLADSLLKTDLAKESLSSEDHKIKKTIITSLLKSSSLGLVETILQFRKSSDKNYLILVDQFEELFRFKDSSSANSLNDTLAFINLLMEAINYKGAPIYVAITMRSDFIGECSQFPELTKKINDSQYLIPQMTRDQKRRAITGPVAVGDAEVAPRLVQQLLNDLGDNPDQLPILQHALMRNWDYWTHFRDYEAEPLDIKHYEAIGTMAEALSMHANEAYDELDEEQKRVCEFLFKAITEKRGSSYGIRRPTKLNEIAAIADTSEEELIKVIDKFRDPSRSLLTPQYGITLESDSIIDISHESIMRIWNRLKNWVNDEEDAKIMYNRLAEAAEMYQEGKTGLWRPPDLQLAINWQEKHQPTLIWGKRYHPAFERTMAFLKHSEEEYALEQREKELAQKRRLRTARITALIMGGAVVICILFLIYAFIQQTEAERQRERAEQQSEKALIASDSAKYQAKLALQEKERANQQMKLAEERGIAAMLASDSAKQQARLAEFQRNKAQEATKEANLASEQAKRSEQAAKKSEKIAQREKEQATKLQYLATAKAISSKAVQLNDQQLKGLLARQAYVFDERYNSYRYNPDIYSGLYSALKSFDDPFAKRIKAHDKAARVVISSEEANVFYTGGSQGEVIQWSIENGNWKADSIAGKRPRRVVKSMYLDQADQSLYVAGQLIDKNGKTLIEKYDLAARSKPVEEITGVEGSFVKMRGTASGILLLDQGGKSIKLLSEGKVSTIFTSDTKINDFDFDGTNGGIWLAKANGDLSFLTGDSKKDSVIYHNENPITSVKSFFYLVIGDNKGRLKLFMDQNYSTYTDLTGHEGNIDDLSISKDGLFLLSASKDKTVRVWNMSEPTKPPLVLDDHSNWVWSADISPQNDFVYTVNEDGYLRIWPLSMSKMADKLCSYIERDLSNTEWATYIGSNLEKEKTCGNE